MEIPSTLKWKWCLFYGVFRQRTPIEWSLLPISKSMIAPSASRMCTSTCLIYTLQFVFLILFLNISFFQDYIPQFCHRLLVKSDLGRTERYRAILTKQSLVSCEMVPKSSPSQKAKCKLHKNAAFYFEYILEAAFLKTAALRPLASHLRNHPFCNELLDIDIAVLVDKQKITFISSVRTLGTV